MSLFYTNNGQGANQRFYLLDQPLVNDFICCNRVTVISRKRTVYNTTYVSNGWYVLDQHSNCMFRLLEAIFRLHKIELYFV